MNPTPPFYALLVGIDTYDPQSRVPQLRGCVADVDNMARLLHERFGVPAANILRLTNEEATHQGIKEAFRRHLIDQARHVTTTEDANAAPAFLFHYSGHGSQALDESGSEPDGLDETLVPYNSRTPGVFDIKDWELGSLIEEINAFSDNVTIILDCCHSGSGTRDVNLARTRRCPPDLRPQPAASQRPGNAGSAATQRSVGAGNWEIGGHHVLLAGCRDKEESNEYAVTAGGTRYWQGAMSYFLQQELQQLPPARTVTYRELFERVRHAVNQTYANQMPQCEGDIDRELFGGLHPAREPFYTVIDRREGLFWIDGGVAHGLTVGSELKVYAPETRTLAAAGDPLATLRVVDEGAVTSGCEPLEAHTAVPLHGRCAIYRLNPGSMQRRVQVAINDEALRHAIEQRLRAAADQTAGDDVSPWLTVAEAPAAADFRVTLVEQQMEIQDNSGKLLVAPFPPHDLDGLARDLAHLARYENALALRNRAPSELAGAVTLAIKQLVFDPETQAPIATDFARSAGGELLIESGERVVIEVTNQSDQPLYFAIFDFAPDWAVTQLYPTVKGAHEPLKVGGVFAFGLTNRRRGQIAAALPAGMAEAVERFKVIATVHETNFALLQQGALKTPFVTRAVRGSGADAAGQTRSPSALDELLGQAINGNQRAFRVPPATVADEWTTAELSVRVIEPAAQMTRQITPGSRTVLPAYGITIDAPAAFTGQIRVLTERQATRAATLANEAAPPIPPGLAPYGTIFQPLPLGNRRSAMPLGTVVELEADDAARQAITAATPLTLHLDWPVDDEAERVLAIAYADGLFYPVGHSDANRQEVAISWLPSADGTDAAGAGGGGKSEIQEADEALVIRRSLGRVLKLYLYKMVGWQEPTLGLHRVRYLEPAEVAHVSLAPGEFLREFTGGALIYSPIDATAILPRQRVAVAVHGFSANSLAIGIWLTTVLPKHYPAYDHVLAFDYESLATGINENASALADALRALELDVRPRVRVDLFAHSMGTLVTRAMVELWGGDTFVKRCFLAGPPNQGTRLADAKVLVPWLATLALNGVGGWTPAAIAQWTLGKVAEDAAGVEDLRPSSSLLANLNQSTKAVAVSYFILAGNNPLLPQQDEGMVQRLKRHLLQGVDLALDTIFDDQNDLVINVKSMLGVRNGNYPPHLLQRREVPCNHFTYFSEATAQAQLLTWLR